MIEKALRYITDLKALAMSPQVVEIAGKTYCNKKLERYDEMDLARKVSASTLSSMVDYIRSCGEELRGHMIIHVESPTQVSLYSGLLKDRKREYLFESVASVPDFHYDRWYDQERFLIELQADFEVTQDLLALQKVTGNVEAKSTATYGDDGISQKTTIKQGIASKADVIVPNPVTLRPYRTFLEVAQPDSQFVFRIRDEGGSPQFKIVEAEGGLWKNEAMIRIKNYFLEELKDILADGKITVIA